MTLGIIGLAMLLCCYPVTFVLGLTALILGATTPKTASNRGQAVAGMVMGIVGIVLAMLIIAVVVLVSMRDPRRRGGF
jgi:hypothetical protein